MAFKKSLKLILCILVIFSIFISLFFFLLPNYNTIYSKYSNNNTNNYKNYGFDHHMRRHHIHRKMLQNNKNNNQLFDFTPFKSHHRKHVPVRSEPEIDPLYGVEKRLVPTGPNPLHH